MGTTYIAIIELTMVTVAEKFVAANNTDAINTLRAIMLEKYPDEEPTNITLYIADKVTDISNEVIYHNVDVDFENVKVFWWDWKETPDLDAMFEFVNKLQQKGLPVFNYYAQEGSDTYNLIICPLADLTKPQVEALYEKYCEREDNMDN